MYYVLLCMYVYIYSPENHGEIQWKNNIELNVSPYSEVENLLNIFIAFK